jgi:hypothetical protein
MVDLNFLPINQSCPLTKERQFTGLNKEPMKVSNWAEADRPPSGVRLADRECLIVVDSGTSAFGGDYLW